MKKPIKVGELFTVEKMEDKFYEVKFKYDDNIWEGVIPSFLVYQAFQLDDNIRDEFIAKCYEYLNPKNQENWIKISNTYWKEVLNRNFSNDQTYDVLKALYSGIWECRVCGPVKQVNPQPSSRLRDLKKFGYVIGSKRRHCRLCDKSTMHDILVMIKIFDISQTKSRHSISPKLAKKIKKSLNYIEVCFDVRRPEKELIIDHKFPSQRWTSGETKNPNDMSDKEIHQKFQLLSNQTNLLKSRVCDRCVKEGIRGSFMGISWYYSGDEFWRGEHKSDENGCIGCPWYDLAHWKSELKKNLT